MPHLSSNSTRAHAPRRAAGFTLLEIVVVVAILTVLAGAAIPVAGKMLTSAARKTTRDELAQLGPAALEFFRDTNRAPKSIAELEVDPGASDPNWAGPYLPGAFSDGSVSGYTTDAWSRPYVVSTSGAFKITSRGEDGLLGDSNDIAISVDFTPVLREKTLEKLRVANQAITLYNGVYLTTAPLPTKWNTALATLVSKGFLPATAPYAKDAWGDAYTADPAGKAPLVHIMSKTLGSSK